MAARQSHSLKKIIEAEKSARHEYRTRQAARKAEEAKERMEERQAAMPRSSRASSPMPGPSRREEDDEMEEGLRREEGIRRVYPRNEDVATYPLSERSPDMRLNMWWHKYNVPEDRRNKEVSLQLRRCPGGNVSELVADIADLYSVKLSLPEGGTVDINVLVSSPEARTNPEWELPFNVVDSGWGVPAYVVEPQAWFNYLTYREDI